MCCYVKKRVGGMKNQETRVPIKQYVHSAILRWFCLNSRECVLWFRDPKIMSPVIMCVQVSYNKFVLCRIFFMFFVVYLVNLPFYLADICYRGMTVYKASMSIRYWSMYLQNITFGVSSNA